MSDWGGDDSWDFGGFDWTGGFDLPGGGDGWTIQDPWQTEPGFDAPSPGGDGWTSGGDLPGGGDGPPVWGGAAGGGGMGDALSKFAKMLGLTKKDGSVDLSSLLPLIAGIGGSVYGMNQQGKATNQMQDAITNSNKIITDTLGGNKELYKPYQEAGVESLGKIRNMAPSNLAGNFGPLAGNYNPLGSGKGIKLSQLGKGR